MSFRPKSQPELDALVQAGAVDELRAYEAAAKKEADAYRAEGLRAVWYGNAVIARKKAEIVVVKLHQASNEEQSADDLRNEDQILRSVLNDPLVPESSKGQLRELLRIRGFAKQTA